MVRLCGFRRAQLLCVLAVLLPAGGCQPPASAPVPIAPASPDSKAEDAVPISASAEESKLSLVRETWDAVCFGDAQVGFVHTRHYAFTLQGEPHVRIESDSLLRVERFGQRIQQKLTTYSVESLAGEIIECGSRKVDESSGGEAVEMTTSARVDGRAMILQVSTRGSSESRTIAWDNRWRGFFALEQEVEGRPFQPGEQRRLRALLPVLNQLGDMTLTAADYEPTMTLDETQSLLRIDVQLTVGGTELDQTLWVNRDGEILKSHMPALNQTSYRTTRDRAVAESAGGAYDLGEHTLVRTAFPAADPHGTQRAVYVAKLGRGDAGAAFDRGATQLVRAAADGTVELVVRALRPDTPQDGEFPANESPQPADLKSNSLVQSDDEQVRALAASVAADSRDPWVIATALERLVRQYVSTGSFSQAMATAADVVRSREGDCTEHAVLLAALCRAREIPARVAIGLVYSAPLQGFAYHMWNEVWIHDRWVPLDGTLGRGGIGAAHLKVSDSSLEGVDPFSQFLPVFRLLGNLELSVKEVR